LDYVNHTKEVSNLNVICTVETECSTIDNAGIENNKTMKILIPGKSCKYPTKLFLPLNNEACSSKVFIIQWLSQARVHNM